MRCQNSLLISSMLTVLSSALPTDDVETGLKPRDEPNGNLLVTIHDKTVPIGTAPVDVVFGNFADSCSVNGKCATSDIEINDYNLWSEGRNPSSNTQITITVTPDGSYPTWIHNGLLDALKATLDKIKKCNQVTYTYPSETDRHSTTLSKTVEECVIPKYIGITYQVEDAHNAAPPNLGFKTVTKNEDSGFCDTFTDIGGAVAGAVNGVAGGVFTFLKLACQKDDDPK